MNIKNDSGQPVVVLDDSECIKILTDANMLDTIMRKPKSEKDNISSVLFQHEGFHVMACRHFGHEDEDKNGFVVTLLPEQSFSKEEASKLFAETIAHSASQVEDPEIRVEQCVRRDQKPENN